MNIPLKDRTFTGIRTPRDQAEALGTRVGNWDPSPFACDRAAMFFGWGYTLQIITWEKRDKSRTVQFLRPGEDPAASPDGFPEWPEEEKTQS